MRCQMSAHANSIYRCIYLGHKNLFLYLSADWRLAPRTATATLIFATLWPRQRVCMRVAGGRNSKATADLAGQLPSDFLESGA